MNVPDAAYAGFSDQLFDWAPDADRLEREVSMAEARGVRDDLTLAEIECSIDLLDDEISSHQGPASIARTEIRRRLASLAARLQRLPAA